MATGSWKWRTVAFKRFASEARQQITIDSQRERGTTMFRRWSLPALAACCIGFMSYHLVRTHGELPDLEPVVTPARAPYEQVVAAAGLIEPCSESISVGSPLQGVVEEVAVSEGQRVKAGDLLFRLDDRELRAQLAVREADLAA